MCGELLFSTAFARCLRNYRCLIPFLIAVSPPRGISVWPAHITTSRAPTINLLSRLNHAAPALAVYASQRRVTATPRKTRLQLVANLYCAGLSPAGFHRGFPPCLHGFLLTQASLAQCYTKHFFENKLVPSERSPFGSASGEIAGAIPVIPRKTSSWSPPQGAEAA